MSRKKTKLLVNPSWLLFLVAIIGISWIFVNFYKNSLVNLIYYTLVISVQQFIFNVILPVFYSLAYEIFSQKKFHKQNGFSLALRMISSSLLIILLTFFIEKFNFAVAFSFFSGFISLMSIISLFSYYKIKNKL